jgi:two-component system, NarL family, invasion response regulator UvrY
MPATFLIVDYHLAVRTGLVHLLHHHFPGAGIEAVDSAAEALFAVTSSRPSLVILDLSLPGRGGLEIIKHIKDASPATGVLIYTMYPEDQFGIRTLRAGADGYLTKDQPEETLVAALQLLLSGKRYISPALAEALANFAVSPESPRLHDLLSDRELQILILLAKGHTPTAIAADLHLSVKTVSTYRARLLNKLNLDSNAALVRFALNAGLIA